MTLRTLLTKLNDLKLPNIDYLELLDFEVTDWWTKLPIDKISIVDNKIVLEVTNIEQLPHLER